MKSLEKKFGSKKLSLENVKNIEGGKPPYNAQYAVTHTISTWGGLGFQDASKEGSTGMDYQLDQV